jgi:hypothetical protein
MKFFWIPQIENLEANKTFSYYQKFLKMTGFQLVRLQYPEKKAMKYWKS